MGRIPPPVRLAAPPGRTLAPWPVAPRTQLTTVPIMSLVAWLVLVAGLTIAGSRMAEMFRDFGVALDGGTRALLSTSDWLRGRRVGQVLPGIAIAFPLVVGVHVGLIFAGLRPRHVRWARPVASALLAGAILIIFYGVFALAAANVSLARSIQQTGP